MNYEQAIAYIESLSPTKINPGLERFKIFMEAQNNPQDSFYTVHIAGTNGKGSVSSLVSDLLQNSGLLVGKFTGPHILRFNERIALNNKAISDQEFAQLLSELKEKSEHFAKQYPEHGILTWFELLTAMAFFWFSRQKVDIAVLEVGLGGRFDATNIIKQPLVAAITNIDLDHTHILGKTIPEITKEKAAIIKKFMPVVTGCTQNNSLGVIRTKSKNMFAPLFHLETNSSFKFLLEDYTHNNCMSCEESQTEDNIKSKKYIFEQDFVDKLNTNLNYILQNIKSIKGYAQNNMSLALAIVSILEEQLKKSFLAKDPLSKSSSFLSDLLSKHFWPGRMQYFPKHNLLLDVAHNEAGAKELRKSLEKIFGDKNFIFILSFYETKDSNCFLKQLIKKNDFVYATESTGKRATISKNKILEQSLDIGVQAQAAENYDEAFKLAFEKSNSKTLIIATGSFATVKAALNYLNYQSVEESQIDSLPLLYNSLS